jgi:hypothetical protein
MSPNNTKTIESFFGRAPAKAAPRTASQKRPADDLAATLDPAPASPAAECGRGEPAAKLVRIDAAAPLDDRGPGAAPAFDPPDEPGTLGFHDPAALARACMHPSWFAALHNELDKPYFTKVRRAARRAAPRRAARANDSLARSSLSSLRRRQSAVPISTRPVRVPRC